MTKQPQPERYVPKNHVRIVTAASLFDGHDAAINLMRRLLQASGAEVIHLGHNRSAQEIVECAIEEDAQAIAVTSYQGGHLEFFQYMYDLLKERGADIRLFGGGGGTILPAEIEALHAYGVTRIYSPDDGRTLGLQGMINDLLERCDFPVRSDVDAEVEGLEAKRPAQLGRLITLAENDEAFAGRLRDRLAPRLEAAKAPILGITGTGGSGKSSLVDELVRRFVLDFEDKQIAVISVDPSKRKTGGALLGDRIRMNSVSHPRVYMRSLATRQSNLALSMWVQSAIDVTRAAGFDLVVVETSGIGQSDTEIVDHSDVSLYVMTSEYGAATQLEKIDMIDFADVIAINKFDKPGSLDALRDVRKQYRRTRTDFESPDDALPIHGTIASQFNDPGTNGLYKHLVGIIAERTGAPLESRISLTVKDSEKVHIIPPQRVRYLAEIAEVCEAYDRRVEAQAEVARQIGQVRGAIDLLREGVGRRELSVASGDGVVEVKEEVREEPSAVRELQGLVTDLESRLDHRSKSLLEGWPELQARYGADKYRYEVRGRVIEQDLYSTSLSGTRVSKVALPRYKDPGDLLSWLMRENAPGFFPYTAGVFPLKRSGEAPARMFAGEGGPERTNRRFHYVSGGMPAKRLSTAFDSVTLYGEDPDHRPDIYGKVGNSGVSVCSVDDAKKLYSGFDLADPKTSVSMTINGPAPILLGFFMNAAIDQGCEKHIRSEGLTEQVESKIDQLYRDRDMARPRYQGELPKGSDGLGLMLLGVSGHEVLPRETYERIKADVMGQVRGTVQADILKEDQAQNTCIFSTEFALRMMGDIQAYFTAHRVRNFYSVSISGYHIAEAGANPISQLAFTLANGFTFVEYYLSRGMKIDEFAPNLSFFFSNGMDPEYSVLGRVARRIWAKAMAEKYGANERSQKLKYHIQTSGRSLHAQEIAFNDIRTTLQALYAIYDNCNSLHTNAYDEAITTPTEESVRRALAIQLIIDQELGLAKNENPMQGSFVTEELTDLVESAVLTEFRRISDRGGVLGAMERMYQRSKIQEESLHYETLKHTGELPIVGVNTFLDPQGSPTIVPGEVIRATTEEKVYAIESKLAFQRRNDAAREASLARLSEVCLTNGNVFEALLSTCQVATLGQISGALYEVGGQYRRNMWRDASTNSDEPLPDPAPTALRRPLPERLVVVGDLNGHLRLFDQLLVGTGLMDANEAWTGGDAVLVQIGDVVNRGSASRACMDRILRLRRSARREGGDVVWLLGNHEVMTGLGHEAYVTSDEYLEFADPSEISSFFDDRTRYVYELLGSPHVPRPVDPIGGRVQAWEEDHAPGRTEFRQAFAEDGLYGRHLRSLPVAVQMGPLVFVHGGLGPPWAELGLEGLDMMAKETWSRCPAGYQALDAEGVFRDPLGPLWHRAYAVSDTRTVEKDAARALELLDASLMIVGHTRTETVPGGETGRPLLRQGRRVLMCDVGIGEPGEPGAALIIEHGRIDAWSPIDGRYVVADDFGT